MSKIKKSLNNFQKNLFITNSIFFIIGFVLFLTYVGQLKTITTVNGIKVTKPKNLIYSSLAFVITNIIICLILMKSMRTSKINSGILILSFLLFILDILFVVIPYQSPSNQTNNHQLNTSIPKKFEQNLIILETLPNPHYSHFVHYMQYLYWCIDLILSWNDPRYRYIIVEPTNKSDSSYVNAFLQKLTEKMKNIQLISKSKYLLRVGFNSCSQSKSSTVYKKYEYKFSAKRKVNFNLNNDIISGKVLNWFPNNNSSRMRDLFVHPRKPSLTIGLVNRRHNRKLLNYKELCDKIKEKFNVSVDIAFFEDKTFTYQTKFFNEHKIIISSHGAQLCSIPFAQDDSLIIECVHEEWHPYDYFPGLSFTSNKYHYMICDDHSVFPKWYSDKYMNSARGNSNNSKLNIIVNVEKVINIIDNYLKNNQKLENYNCNLV